TGERWRARGVGTPGAPLLTQVFQRLGLLLIAPLRDTGQTRARPVGLAPRKRRPPFGFGGAYYRRKHPRGPGPGGVCDGQPTSKPLAGPAGAGFPPPTPNHRPRA